MWEFTRYSIFIYIFYTLWSLWLDIYWPIQFMDTHLDQLTGITRSMHPITFSQLNMPMEIFTVTCLSILDRFDTHFKTSVLHKIFNKHKTRKCFRGHILNIHSSFCVCILRLSKSINVQETLIYIGMFQH